MSHLRKSASFRSRIPVRRARMLPTRRCPSPTMLMSTNSNDPDWSIPPQSAKRNRNRSANNDRNYSSSSFSSSDESNESAEPLQRLIRQFADENHSFYISNDAISLDGLLDSISSGSFSSLPSPTAPATSYYGRKMSRAYSTSYEVLPKFNRPPEALKLRTSTNDYNMVPPSVRNTDEFGELKDNKMISTISSTKCTPEEMSRHKGSAMRMIIRKDNKNNREMKQDENASLKGYNHDTSKCTQKPIGGGSDERLEEDICQMKSNALNHKPVPMPRTTKAFPVLKVASLSSMNSYREEMGRGGDSGGGMLYKHANTSSSNTLREIESTKMDLIVGSTNVNRVPDACNGTFSADGLSRQLSWRHRQMVKRDSNNDNATNASSCHHCHENIKDHCSSVGSNSIRREEQHVDKRLLGATINAQPSQAYPSYSYHRHGDRLNQINLHNSKEHEPVLGKAGSPPQVHQDFERMVTWSSPTRMRRIPKRFDESSTSSFEHINMTTGTSEMPMDTYPGNYESRTSTSSFMKNTFRYNILPKVAEHKEMKLTASPIMERFDRIRHPLPLAMGNHATVSSASIFPPKTTSYRSECELSGSYVSLECPSPPGPPTCLPESRRDPQARLGSYLKTLYIDLALKEPVTPQWAIPVSPGALCPARLEPELRLHAQSHGYNDTILVDQLLTSIHTKEGAFLEAPRRVLIECPPWTSRSSLVLKILYAWAKEPPWPPKGSPVALALFIPLSEIKRSFANYVEKELLPKGPFNPFSNSFGGFTSAWNSLESLGGKLLFVLDGYDHQRGSPKRKGKHYPPDLYDLLNGKLFPEARVIITMSSQGNNSTSNNELLPHIQRHVTFEGLTWGRSASLLGGGQWGAPARLLDTVQECASLRRIVRTPLGCLSIAAIFEATGGDLPTDDLDVVESVLNCIAPETSAKNIAELGRLALFCLKMSRPSITLSEIRMYCSSPESSTQGCLDRNLLLGKSARKKGEYVYHFMCADMAEFLAANYIASLANRSGLLAAEIAGLLLGEELDPELFKVIKFAMGLLGSRAHVLLSKLTPLWLTPQTIFSLALAGGSSPENLSALCDILGISKHPPMSPLETKPIWVQVRSVPNELMGWGMALRSPSCALKNLELIYQIEKHVLLDSRSGMEVFLDSLSHNESVSTLRVSSLIENEVKDAEINYLANCISKMILKPRLESFELVLTLLEEDPPILKLQPVVAVLCRAIPKQTKLSSLLLDLGLSTSQLVQLCTMLDKCPHITRLSLPHLRCERGAVGALAALLTMRPLSFLALPSSWGARDDPPSSSGVSMGSGSGSSTGTSGLIKQSSLTGVSSPRTYAPGLFSSLPRGVYVPTANMGRSATLPRQPLEAPADKRSSDSVVSKSWYPTPACDGGPHSSGTLHDLLLATREPYSKLHGLDLSKAQLSLEDSMCLGETVRLSITLHTLKLEGASRLSEVLPSILGASESPSLQMLSIGSPRLNLDDTAISMSARALTSCSTLRLLNLDGWTFRIENISTLSIIRAFLSLTSIRELSLCNCRLQIGIISSSGKTVNAFESRSVVVLKMSGAQAIMSDSVPVRGPHLLPFVSGFPCLRELDLSAPARSGLGSSISTPLIIDDKSLITFFQSLHTYFSLLNTLKICNWVIHFDDTSKTLKSLTKCIRNSPISHLKLDGISVLDRPKKLRIESQLLHCFIASLPQLRWLGITLSNKREDQITAIGNAVLDLKGYEIDIKLSDSSIEHAKLMAQAISLDGKFDIKVSTFGTSSGILIHAEKSGTKSLNRKNKD